MGRVLVNTLSQVVPLSKLCHRLCSPSKVSINRVSSRQYLGDTATSTMVLISVSIRLAWFQVTLPSEV